MNLAISLVCVCSILFSQLEAKNSINLSNLVNSSFQEALQEAGCLPVFVDLSKEELENIYKNFTPYDNLDEICFLTKSWCDEFALSEEAAPWKNTNYKFGVFDSSGPTHKKRRLIEGISCKICREYCEWVKKNYDSELSSIPEVKLLFNKLMDLEKVCHQIFKEKLLELAPQYPAVMGAFYEGKLPITMRLIRFNQTGNFCLPFHQDISVLSLIFPSDDDPSEECLVVAPATSKEFKVEELKRVIRPVVANSVSTLLISGTLLNYLGVPLFPTPHAVLPHQREARYVITACCHIAHLNTSDMSTAIDLEEIPKQFQ